MSTGVILMATRDCYGCIQYGNSNCSKKNFLVKFRALFGVILAVSPHVCNAAWIYNLTPKDIRLIGPAGDVTFRPSNIAVLSGCPNADFYIIKQENSSDMALSILITAKTTGKNVHIYVDDSKPICSSYGRPLFTDIMLGE